MSNVDRIKTPDGTTYMVQDTVSGYQTSSDVQAAISGKQDTLVSGTNIKTINGDSLLGSGDIETLKSSDSSQISGWGMPSTRYTNLTLGSSGTQYTAPANGWYMLSKKSSAQNQYAQFNTNIGYSIALSANGSSTSIRLLMPVLKGTIVTPYYDLGGATSLFRFYYAEGEQ